MRVGLTEVLAFWGAALSSVTFLWNVRRDLRDRAHVKLNILHGDGFKHFVTKRRN